MGKEAISVSVNDVNKLIGMLNGALAEEWLAYYQYWIGARLLEGPMRLEVGGPHHTTGGHSRYQPQRLGKTCPLCLRGTFGSLH